MTQKVGAFYQRLFDEVERRQNWLHQPESWDKSNGLVEVERLTKSSSRRISYAILFTARIKLRHETHHLVSVDMQWGVPGDTTKKEARKLLDYLQSIKHELEADLQAKTGMPGIIRLWNDTLVSNWRMEGGFVHDQGVDLFDPAQFEFLANWFVICVPHVHRAFRQSLVSYNK
jgi:hypothetical protein